MTRDSDGSISDAIIGIGSKVFQEVVGSLVSGLGGFALIRAYVAEGGEEFFLVIGHSIVPCRKFLGYI